jgi:uncharacterized membrane protein HdeD (DUF308 family)
MLSRLVRLGRDVHPNRSWRWQLLLGVLAIGSGIMCIALPARILLLRVIALAVGDTESFSGGMRALAAVLAIVVVLLFENLFRFFSPSKAGIRTHTKTVRIIIGLAVLFAIFWPDRTVYSATVLVAGCALVLGILEISLTIRRPTGLTYQALTVGGGLILIGFGVFSMQRVFVGAVLILIVVGVAGIVRGALLIGNAVHARASAQRGAAEPPHSSPLAA